MAQLLHLTGQALRSATGTPYTSAKAYFYETGTTSPKNTYSDAGLTSANTNPVVADGTTGLFPDIYLLAGRYKVVLQQSDGTAIDTWDPLDATQQIITATAAPSPAYPFMVYHNSTDGHRYRRNAANTAWIDEGLVDSLGNAATVTQQLAGTATDAFSTPDSVAALVYRGSDIAAGSTISLPATGGGAFNLTGTATTINGISSASGGREVELRMNAAHTLTHNGTSFILPGAANITAASGDVFCFRNEAASDATGSNWRCTNIERASGSPVNITDQLGSQSDAETNTSTTKTLSILNLKFHPGMCKVWANVTYSAGVPTLNDQLNMTSITDTATGRLTFTIATDFSNATWSYSCSSAAPSAGSEVITNIRQGTQTAGVIEVTTQNTGGVDTDAESICIQGWGDFA